MSKLALFDDLLPLLVMDDAFAAVVKSLQTDLSWADQVDAESEYSSPRGEAGSWADVVRGFVPLRTSCSEAYLREASPESCPRGEHGVRKGLGENQEPDNASPHPNEAEGTVQNDNQKLANKNDVITTWANIVSAQPSGSEAYSEYGVLKDSRLKPEKVETQTEYGAPIGIRAVQSILMSATQTSLSHFHTAGMEDENTGVHVRPSIADALNCTYRPNNTSMTFVTDEPISSIRKSIVYADLNYFVSMVRVSLEAFPERENIWYETLGQPMSAGDKLRLYIDYRRLRKFGLTLRDIGNICFSADGINCTWAASPDFMGMIDIDSPSEYISPFLSRMEYQVCGTKDISACERSNSGFVTVGSNILVVSKVLKKEHKSTLRSNNVADVERRFGVEAAARVLKDLVGSGIVSDFMARTGKILSFSKHSVEVRRKGLLASMGFERPKDDIKRALVRPDILPGGLSSVYSRIIIGEDPKQEFDIVL